jgi:glucans biosynthesis protein C
MNGTDSPPDRVTERVIFLDWVRIIAFGMLVFYHVGMYYVTWEFHIKSPHAGTAIEPLMRLSNPWRMDLLFLVSGATTSFMSAPVARDVGAARYADRQGLAGVWAAGLAPALPRADAVTAAQKLPAKLSGMGRLVFP